MAVKPIPDGYHTLTPYLILRGGPKALEFYKRAFGAVELMRLDGPNDTIAHAEIRIGDSVVMLSDEMPGMGFHSAQALGGTPVGLMLYVEDSDHVFQRALDAGGTMLRPMADHFYGDRSGTITDPFGHVWTISTHKEDVSPEEMNRRMAAMHPQPA